jgi:hypothetical protein
MNWIHERAVQLANEQDALRAAERQLDTVQASLAEEHRRSQCVRSKYLKSKVQANSLELECCKMKDLIAERVSKTNKLKLKESQIVQQIATQMAECEVVVAGKLVQHTVRQELYKKILQGAILARTQAVAHCKLKLETAIQLASKLKRDLESILQEQQQSNQHDANNRNRKRSQ